MLGTTVDLSKLRVGDKVRTLRPSEMSPPEWYLDHSSGGRYYVNYGKNRKVPVDLLDEIWIVEGISPAGDGIHASEYIGNGSGITWLGVRPPTTWLWDTLLAEILTDELATPRCDCGKEKARDPGPHSHWCSTRVLAEVETDLYEYI